MAAVLEACSMITSGDDDVNFWAHDLLIETFWILYKYYAFFSSTGDLSISTTLHLQPSFTILQSLFVHNTPDLIPFSLPLGSFIILVL